MGTTIEKCLTCKHAFTTGKDRLYCKKSLADKDDCGEYEMATKALEQDSIAQERYEDLCEYFGEVKDILKNRDDFKAWLGRVKWHIRKAEELSAENDDLRDQLAMRDRFKQEPKSPCDLCRYNPPSSADGKPCTMCPATERSDKE